MNFIGLLFSLPKGQIAKSNVTVIKQKPFSSPEQQFRQQSEKDHQF
jgi:hypothetical protein